MLPIVLRAMQIAPKAAQYARKSKFMGMAEVVAPKALPAPSKAVTAAAGKSSIRTALGNTAKLAPVAVAASAVPDNKPASNANSGSGTIDTSKGKTLSADDVALASKAMGVKTQASSPKVVRVQTGTKDGTKTSAVSTGTTSVTSKAPEVAEVKPSEGATIKAADNVQSVQGAGNMDAPKDPSEGVSEEELKRIGLEESNKELAAKGGGSLLQRLKDGNIDQAGSAAYNKYGAGYGREVLRRRLAAAKAN